MVEDLGSFAREASSSGGKAMILRYQAEVSPFPFYKMGAIQNAIRTAEECLGESSRW